MSEVSSWNVDSSENSAISNCLTGTSYRIVQQYLNSVTNAKWIKPLIEVKNV
jgi:hypothetical protein